ncbi:MAG: carbohydrate kinase family protein, partial [Gemmatimonadota bacterium]
VVPIARLGADLADSALRFVGSLPNVAALDGLEIRPEPNNRVELRYHDGSERTERLSGGVAPWTPDALLPQIDGLDALYINFITGYEFELAGAMALRAASPLPIYADLHSLFLGAPGEGPRPPRRLPRWDDWARCFDLVQLNEAEAGLLGLPRSEPAAILNALPGPRPSVALVTRGGRGASYAQRRDHAPGDRYPASPEGERGEPLAGEMALEGGRLGGDPTGCGDVWGSVLFAGLLEGRALEDAVRRAHPAPPARIRTPRIEELPEAVASSLTA